MTTGHHAINYYTFTRCDGLAWGALLATETRLITLHGGVKGKSLVAESRTAVFAMGVVFTAAGVVLALSRWGDRWSATALLTSCSLLFVGSMGFI